MFPDSFWVHKNMWHLCLNEPSPLQAHEKREDRNTKTEICHVIQPKLFQLWKKFVCSCRTTKGTTYGQCTSAWTHGAVKSTQGQHYCGFRCDFNVLPRSFSLYCNMKCWKLDVKNFGSAMLLSVSAQEQPEWWHTQKPIAFFLPDSCQTASTYDSPQFDSLLIKKPTLKTNHFVDQKLRHVLAWKSSPFQSQKSILF